MASYKSSYDNATVGQGNVVNDVERAYNSFSQLVTEYQEHSGAVNTSTSVNVQYQYAGGSANTNRPTAVIYPSQRVLNYSYGTSGGMDDALSRIASLIDSDVSTHLADYTRLGAASIVQVGYAQPGINYSLINGSGNDPYTGLDKFNRVVDCRWYATGSNTDVARIQHGYDLAGNRLWRSDPVARSNGVHQDELYSYDGLYRLSLMQRGQLNSTQTGIVSGTLSFAQAWGLDATGNWAQFWEDDSGSSWNLQQTRTASLFNEITGITGGGWVQPAYDAAGNMVRMPQPASPTSGYEATCDAWNRLISLWASGSLVQQNSYDGTNRRVTKLSSGTTRHYYYSSRWQPLEERVGGSTTYDRQFVWGLRYIDDLVLRDSVTYGRLFCLQDPNWNSIAICDSTGAIKERYRYSAYGQPTFLAAAFVVQSSSGYNWETLYVGLGFDRESMLCLARSRWLDVIVGTFLSRDVVGFAAGSNFYGYVHSRPIDLTDAFGTSPCAHAPGDASPGTPGKGKGQCQYATYSGSEKPAGLTGKPWAFTFYCAGLKLVGPEHVVDSKAGLGAVCKKAKADGCCVSTLYMIGHGNRYSFSGKGKPDDTEITELCKCLCTGATIKLLGCYCGKVDPVDPGSSVDPPGGGIPPASGKLGLPERLFKNCNSLATVEGCTGCYQPNQPQGVPAMEIIWPKTYGKPAPDDPCTAERCAKVTANWDLAPRCDGTIRTYTRGGDAQGPGEMP